MDFLGGVAAFCTSTVDSGYYGQNRDITELVPDSLTELCIALPAFGQSIKVGATERPKSPVCNKIQALRSLPTTACRGCLAEFPATVVHMHTSHVLGCFITRLTFRRHRSRAWKFRGRGQVLNNTLHTNAWHRKLVLSLSIN